MRETKLSNSNDCDVFLRIITKRPEWPADLKKYRNEMIALTLMRSAWEYAYFDAHLTSTFTQHLRVPYTSKFEESS